MTPWRVGHQRLHDTKGESATRCTVTAAQQGGRAVGVKASSPALEAIGAIGRLAHTPPAT